MMTKDEFLAALSEYVKNEDYRGALRFASLHYPDLQRRLTWDEDLQMTLGPFRMLGDIIAMDPDFSIDSETLIDE